MDASNVDDAIIENAEDTMTLLERYIDDLDVDLDKKRLTSMMKSLYVEAERLRTLITFRTIKWKNFLSTGNQPTEIQLDYSPTTLIIGENGAGKSTILDALCFVLFNKPFRNISKSQLINSVNGGGTVVEVEFNVNNKDVKVIRGIKPNKFEVWIGDTMINQDANARDYQKHLEQQILGLNYRSFTQVVILGSSTFVPFMQLSTRREVVEDILDIKIFSLMNFLLKNKNKSLLEDIRDVEYNYDLTKEKVNLQEKFIEEVVNNKSVIIAENRQKIYDNNFTIDAKKDDVKALQTENDELTVDAEEHTKVEQKLKKLTQTEAYPFRIGNQNMSVKFNFSRQTMNARLVNNQLRNQQSRRRLNLEPPKSETSKTVSQIYKEWNQKNKTDSNSS